MKFKRLSEIGKITMGQSPNSSSYNEERRGIPFYQGNADFGEKYPSERVWCEEPKKIAYPEDILISVRAPIGALNYARTECCIGRGLAAIRIEDEFLRNYVFHLLKARNGELNRKGTGSTFKAIGKNVLEEILVPVIDRGEQECAMRIMDNLEETIRRKKLQMELLDNLVKARFVEMFGFPGMDPFKYGKTKLGSCCEINPKKTKDNRLVDNIEISFVPMTAVSEKGEIDSSDVRWYEDVKKGFTYFTEGDVLFAKITPCMENGKGAVAKGLKNRIGFGSTEFHVLRPIDGISNPYWVYAITSFKSFRKEAESNMTGSAGQRRTPVSFLENYEVSLPPIELQNQFADFVARTDKSKAAVQKSLDETQVLFDSLMQKYFG